MTVWYHLLSIFNRRHALQIAGLLTLCVALTTTLLFATVSHASPGTTKTVSFQGRILTASGGVVPDGNYNMQFTIYQDGTGVAAGNPDGTLKWTENYINNGSTSGVQVKNGFFSVALGSVNPFGSSVDWSQDTLFLSMNIAGSAAGCTTFGSAPCVGDGEMLPMKRITATPYAISAGSIGGKTADNFVQLGQGVQNDVSVNTSSIFVNKTGTGNLLQLQNTGKDVFTLSNSGDLSLGSDTDHTISITTAAASTAGRQLTVAAGAGGSNSTGGDLVLQGGAAGSTNSNGIEGPNAIDAENFETQPNGTTITTANTLFDAVYTSGSGTATFSNEWSINGTMSAKYTDQVNAHKDFAATGTLATRWYMMLPALPSSSTLIGQVKNADTTTAQVRLYPDGTVRVTNGFGADGTTTSALPTGVPIRAEWKINSATNTQEARFYWGANLHGTTPNTTALSTNYTDGNFSTVTIGINSTVVGFTMYVDEFAYGTDWIGPLQYAASNGGNIQLDAGAKSGIGNGGSIFIGSTNASSIAIGSNAAAVNQTINIGANSTAGSVSNVTIGAGGSASSGTTTIQAKNAVTIKTNGTTRATFSDTTNTIYFGNGVTAAAPSDSTLQGTNSSTTAVAGGSLTIQGGNATTGSANGGNVTLAGGTGVGAGANGLVVLTTPTFSTVTNDANCYTGGMVVASNCTIATSSVNNAAAVIVGFSASGQIASLPDPTITTAGRILYVTAAGDSQDFTLSINGGSGADNQITLHANATTTLLWNGSDWTVASAQSSATPPDINSSTINGTANIQIGDGVAGGAPTLFTLDKASSAPTVTDNALLGSMYYDTTSGKVQCYEASGWGSCGASPDNFVTISPEYTNAVMNGTDIGTISSDVCSDTLNINDGSSGQPTVCGTNETYNFYKWTSTESTSQTRSIFVTYQLPSTFKNFVAGSTFLMSRTDSTNSSVTYQIYRDDGSNGLVSCGSAVAGATGVQSTWQKTAASGTADPSNCGFAAGDSVLIRINVTAKSNANAYISNLNFVFNNN